MSIKIQEMTLNVNTNQNAWFGGNDSTIGDTEILIWQKFVMTQTCNKL